MGFYNVYGKISFEIDEEVEAESEVQAKELMIAKIMDYYHLDVSNAHHAQDSVELDLECIEYED